VLHLYAVLHADVSLPADLVGLEGADVRAVSAGRLAGAVSEHAGEPPRPSEEAILRHAHVVERLMGAARAVLPARFGDGFRDEDALRSRLQGRAEELIAALEGVAGRVELSLRVVVREAAPREQEPVPGSGRDYMRRLRKRAEEESRRLRSIHEPLARLAVRSVVHRGGSGAVVLGAAYLVGRDEVDRLRDEVARLQAEHRELALVCTGPWPPYSFAEQTVEAA
jgi:hypothetical protein